MSDKDTKIESTQVYELGFHLVPTLGDDTAGKAFDKVEKLIAKVGGNVVSKSEPALLNLEYTMEKTVDSVKSKYNTAYFAWIIFEGGDVQKLAEELEHDKDVLRNLLIKTDQKESISSEEVAGMLNSEEDEKEVSDEKTEVKEETGIKNSSAKATKDRQESEKEDTVEENSDDTESSDETKEGRKTEESKDSNKSDSDKVDEAIDELIK